MKLARMFIKMLIRQADWDGTIFLLHQSHLQGSLNFIPNFERAVPTGNALS
jgi:hypothetical protein